MGLKNFPHPYTAAKLYDKLNEILLLYILEYQWSKGLQASSRQCIKCDQSVQSGQRKCHGISDDQLETMTLIDDDNDEYESDKEFHPDVSLDDIFVGFDDGFDDSLEMDIRDLNRLNDEQQEL